MNVEETLEAIRNMPWVTGFQIKLVRREPDDRMEAISRGQEDGKIHCWIWYAVVFQVEYGEQIEVPNTVEWTGPGPRPQEMCLPILLKRAHACLEKLEPGAGG